MKIFEIEYDIKYLGKDNKFKVKHLLVEDCYDIMLNDYEFSFNREIDGCRIHYFLKEIPKSQVAKKVYNIMITEVKD